MALEQTSMVTWRFEPGPIDVHTHPRIFDAIVLEEFVPGNDGREGKAGLIAYTEVALQCGITAMIAMPNESARIFDKSAKEPEKTKPVAYPIANIDRVTASQAAISHEAAIPTAIHFGLDPKDSFLDDEKQLLADGKLYERFESAHEECTSLKTYWAETTGGYHIARRHRLRVVDLWFIANPEKPHVMHVEDDDVGGALSDVINLPNGKDMPIHIAHVSSRQELEAVIEAKKAGMNVTCEVTPHHLFLDEIDAQELGGYGCMKPRLKKREDVDFLWSHMDYIDIIASDCAPHRRVDKEADKPAYGVTNHTYMMQLLFGAVEYGKISYEDLYKKLCINPRKRFNLPLEDGSYAEFDMVQPVRGPLLEAERYGYSPFQRLNRKFHLIGNVVEVKAGTSYIYNPASTSNITPSYSHLIRPKNLQ